ncbi:MAG: SUMF1/EgtB/PvdO family nonheme iron enzyme [Gammaproteobacteria bacterium]
MELFFEIAGGQFLGARDFQEDAFLTTYLDDAGGTSKSAVLAIIADGMGGHAAGNIAANLVVSTFNGSVTRSFGSEEFPPLLRECVTRANDSLKESIRETPALDGMGCTLVAAAVVRGKLWWISVGDSHLYLIRHGELSKRNEDHSYGGYLERMKTQGLNLEPDPALSRNMLMSAITGEEIAEIDCPEKPLQLRPGDRLILASDGLDTLSRGQITQFCAWSKSAKDCVGSLLKAVEDGGRPRQDNTTVVVIDVLQRQPLSDTEARSPEQSDATLHPSWSEPDKPRTLEREAPRRLAERTQKASGPAKARAGSGLRRGAVVAVLVLLLAIVSLWFLANGNDSRVGGEGTLTSASPHAAAVGKTPLRSTPSGTEQSPPEPPASTPKNGTTRLPLEAKGASIPQPREVPNKAQAHPTATFRDPLVSGGRGPAMIALSGGSFPMGSSDLSIVAEERPQRQVLVKPFAISQYEITIKEYVDFANATRRKLPPHLPRDNGLLPMHSVSWEDAHAYTRWLSAQTGHPYRLPSEAQWEYAALGGTNTPYWWGFEVGQNQAHCRKCGTAFTAEKPLPVGRFAANPFGLHDTAGNVAEWVQDCFHETYHGAPADDSVWQGGNCTYRIVRGGSFHSAPTAIRSRARSKLRPNNTYDTVGIRVVRELKSTARRPQK